MKEVDTTERKEVSANVSRGLTLPLLYWGVLSGPSSIWYVNPSMHLYTCLTDKCYL